MRKARAIPKVFISTTGQDLELARDIARRLRTAGLEPLTDLTLRSGEGGSKRMAKVIRGADAVLFLLTPAALASPWTPYETGVADGAGKAGPASGRRRWATASAAAVHE